LLYWSYWLIKELKLISSIRSLKLEPLVTDFVGGWAIAAASLSRISVHHSIEQFLTHTRQQWLQKLGLPDVQYLT